MALFYIKMIGSSMILLSGTMLGWHYGRNIQKRYEELNGWKRHFLVIYSDISYGGFTFLEIIQHVMEQSKGEEMKVLQYLESGLKGKEKEQLVDIWNDALDCGLVDSQLTKLDRNELKRVGQNIGNVDREQQLSLLQLYLEKLEQSIQVLEKEKGNTIKMYRMLGILGSIFVVVLLL